MGYEKYILPGDRGWELLYLDISQILLQKVEGGVFLHEFQGDILVQEKIINEVGEGQLSHMKCLGEAEGESFSHCLFLAWKHSDNFLKSVAGYRHGRPKHWFTKVRFDFYSAGPRRNI